MTKLFIRFLISKPHILKSKRPFGYFVDANKGAFIIIKIRNYKNIIYKSRILNKII